MQESDDLVDLGQPILSEEHRTKAARIEAHKVFDRIWKSGDTTRHEAYRWLAEVMQLPEEKAHISQFNPDQCHKLMQLVMTRRTWRRSPKPSSRRSSGTRGHGRSAS